MKRVLLLVFVIGLAIPASAQDVPSIIANQLNSSFASAYDVQWNVLSGERYQANFMQNGIDKKALFSKSGNLLQVIFPVLQKDFPKEVNNSFLKKFPGYEILEATRIEITQEVSFKVRIAKGKEVFEIVFDVFGKIRRQVKIETHSEDAVCEKGDDSYCERHGKKHKVNHSKKEKHGNKHHAREMSSI